MVSPCACAGFTQHEAITNTAPATARGSRSLRRQDLACAIRVGASGESVEVPPSDHGRGGGATGASGGEHLAAQRFGSEGSAGCFGEIPLIPFNRFAGCASVFRDSAE